MEITCRAPSAVRWLEVPRADSAKGIIQKPPRDVHIIPKWVEKGSMVQDRHWRLSGCRVLGKEPRKFYRMVVPKRSDFSKGDFGQEREKCDVTIARCRKSRTRRTIFS
jgi:hypothetical protein